VPAIYRVVLADDMGDFLAWLKALLEDSQRFVVVGEASTGGDALHLVEVLQPDAVLADVDMPGVDGIDVVRTVQERWPEILVVLFSSHAERSYARLAREAGAVAFIPKARLSVEALRQALAGGP